MNGNKVPEVSPLEFARELDAGARTQVIDVRMPSRVASGRIDLLPDEAFHNIAGSRLMTFASLEGTGLDRDIPMTVVCGHGNDSKVVAAHLNRIGGNARSLSGGMAAWMMLSLPRVLPATSSLDRLVQFDRIGKGALAYVLISSGEAMIVDPSRDIQPYLDCVDEAGANLVAVADTHVHADYISGAQTIARMRQVPYYLHQADTVYPYDERPGRLAVRQVNNRMTITVGRCPVEVLHTPGHTEGSVTYRVDRRAAFTGDFLFLSSIGRPDLAGKTEEWAELLWESIQSAKREWPPDLMIYPAHYGSEAERSSDRTIGAPFSEVSLRNESLRFDNRADFMTWVLSNSASFPDSYRTMKGVNVGLISVGEREADELEMGKNECALGGI